MVIHRTLGQQDVRHQIARRVGRQYNDANSDVNNDVGKTLTANDTRQSDRNPTDVERKSDEKHSG